MLDPVEVSHPERLRWTSGQTYNRLVTTTSKPRRRWFQYSLRLLLLVMPLACIGTGWMANRMHRVSKERAATEAIERFGGSVGILYADFRSESLGRAFLRELFGNKFFAHADSADISNDAATKYLAEFARLRELTLQGSQITDGGLEHLTDLMQLRVLRLIGTHVTDAGLPYLEGLAQLEELRIAGSQVTDAGLEHLQGLTQLHSLRVDGCTQVSDAGLENLKELTQLKDLSLIDTQVTDAGLEHLKGFGRLQVLHLGNTKVSDSGVRRLQQALPGCRIFH